MIKPLLLLLAGCGLGATNSVIAQSPARAVDSIAALKALPAPALANERCEVGGYYTPGDGGGGTFFWSPIASYQSVVASPTLVSGGAGYAVGDRVELTTANAYTPAMISVTSVSTSGAITGYTFYPGASYSIVPTGVQAAIKGSTGYPVFYSPTHSTPSSAATFTLTPGSLDDGGSYINPTGNTGPGRWRRAAMVAVPDRVDVRWFGARCVLEGGFDSTAAILAALWACPCDDYLSTSEPGAGGTGHAKNAFLYFCGGPENYAFMLSATLYASQEVHFIGSEVAQAQICLEPGVFNNPAVEQWMIQYGYGSASGNPNTTFNTSVENLGLSSFTPAATNNAGASGLYYVGCNGGRLSNVSTATTRRGIYVDSGGVAMHNIIPGTIYGPGLELHGQQITADYIDAEHINSPANVGGTPLYYTDGPLCHSTAGTFLVPAVLIESYTTVIQNITGEDSALILLIALTSNCEIDALTCNVNQPDTESSPGGPVFAGAALARIYDCDNCAIKHYVNQGEGAVFPNGQIVDYRSGNWNYSPPGSFSRGSYEEFDDIFALETNKLYFNSRVQGIQSVGLLDFYDASPDPVSVNFGRAQTSAATPYFIGLDTSESGYGAVIGGENTGTDILGFNRSYRLEFGSFWNTNFNNFGEWTYQGLNVNGYLHATTLGAADASTVHVHPVTLAAPAITPVGAAGSASYRYAMVALFPQGSHTAVSASGSIVTGNATLSAANYNIVQAAPCPGASSYLVYRTAAASPLTTGYIGTVPVTGNLTAIIFHDTGLPASPASYPMADYASNTTGGIVAATQTTGPTGTVVALHRWVTGTFTSGVVTISDAEILPASKCTPTNMPAGYTGAIGIPAVTAQSAGSVTITSSNRAAANQVGVLIEN